MTTYKEAGVDIAAGNEAVLRIKKQTKKIVRNLMMRLRNIFFLNS